MCYNKHEIRQFVCAILSLNKTRASVRRKKAFSVRYLVMNRMRLPGAGAFFFEVKHHVSTQNDRRL